MFSVIDFLKGYEGQLSNDGCPQGLDMIYRTENQIKMELGLNAWRNLLQDKVIRFAHMMQDMDINVMMKLAGELPQLQWRWLSRCTSAIRAYMASKLDFYA